MKKLILLSLLVFVISIGCVSAQDINQTDDIISSDFTLNNYNSQNIINDAHEGDILLEDDCNSAEEIIPDEKLLVNFPVSSPTFVNTCFFIFASVIAVPIVSIVF